MCEAGGSGNEELKKCPPPSLAVLWFVNVCERKPNRKNNNNKIKSGRQRTVV